MKFNILHFIKSLRTDRCSDKTNNIPDALADYSEIVRPLSRITRDGRALRSEETYSSATFIGDLLHEFLGDDPEPAAKDCCIAGLSILLVMTLKHIPVSAPDWLPEETFLDIASQDAIRELVRELQNIPAQFHDGEMIPNFAQLPLFHDRIPLTNEAVKGFIQRRIAPTFIPEQPSLDVDEVEILDDDESSTRKVNLNEVGPLETDPLDDFDEFFAEFFVNEHKYLDENDDDEPLDD